MTELEGRELDEQMAELMGWKIALNPIDDRNFYHPPGVDPDSYPFDYYVDEWHPSRDIAAAMQVAEKVNLFVNYQLCKSWNGSKWLITKLHKDFDDAEECWLDTFVSADTAPLAICRAALMAAEAGK